MIHAYINANGTTFLSYEEFPQKYYGQDRKPYYKLLGSYDSFEAIAKALYKIGYSEIDIFDITGCRISIDNVMNYNF